MAIDWDSGSSTSSTNGTSINYQRFSFTDYLMDDIPVPQRITKGEPKEKPVKQIFKFDPEELDI
jgi:hypothetical protein